MESGATKSHLGERESDIVPLWLTLGFVACFGVFYVFLSDIPVLTDEILHHLYSRYFWIHPEIMLTPWQRPLYSLLTAPAAVFGYRAQCLLGVLFSVICAGATASIAKHHGIKRSSLIPIILVTLPVYTAVFWNTLSEPIFTAFLACALLCHLRKYHATATFLVGLTPLIRPEGAVVMVVWVGAYLWMGRWRALPWLLGGGGFWICSAWVITGDPFYPLRPEFAYAFDPGLRVIQWDYLLKFYDDFSGPIWFVAIVVGLMASFGNLRQDLRHAVYGSLYLFFMVVQDNLADLPPGHFGWRFMASVSPLVAYYALIGFNLLLDGRDDWSRRRKRAMTTVLAGIGSGWVVVAALYTYRGNPYAPMLVSLSCLGAVAILLWVNAPRMQQRWLRASAISLLLITLAFAFLKAPPYRSTEKDVGIQELAAWWLSNPSNDGRQVWCELPGFYYYTGIDPISSGKFRRLLPGKPGDTIIWDSWGMGRWGRIFPEDLEKAGYKPISSPVSIPGLDLQVYRKPI